MGISDGTPLPFSPCERRCLREVRRMRGLYPRRQTPHPSRCRFASIADAKHRRSFLSTAADGRLCHLLPQGEKEERPRQFPVSNEQLAPPPAFCLISAGSSVQLSFERLSNTDP